MMKQIFQTTAILAFLSSPAIAQSSNPAAVAIPANSVPVIALDEENKGVRLTGEYLSPEGVAKELGADTLAELGLPTALVRTPSGALASYYQPLNTIDAFFGGDGIDFSTDGAPIEVIDLDLENAAPVDPPIEVFPEDMSGQWNMAVVNSENEGCSAQVVAAGEAAGLSMFEPRATTQSPEFVPSELIPDGKFDSAWAPAGTDKWQAVIADVNVPNMATRSSLEMTKASSDLIQIVGTMQFNMPAQLAAIAGMAPKCTYRLFIDATRL